jgi:hypothetical protein
MSSAKSDVVCPEPLAELDSGSKSTSQNCGHSKAIPNAPVRHAVYNAKVAADNASDTEDAADKTKPIGPNINQTERDKLPMLMWWEQLALAVLLTALGVYFVVKEMRSDSGTLGSLKSSVCAFVFAVYLYIYSRALNEWPYR